ncbi:resuscitation-promoting factor RpfA-like [Achroia grisella]|uniref:resuscitation-promoting factor RpfA-like n=1 Tax=Achroia grisella TaxID=688607 RepID=UPI0027D264E6|nr:resuscitation-promoting factor RpfA-like [Achroia grisella]
MKLLITLALLAVASAIPQPLHLQPPSPAFVQNVAVESADVPESISLPLAASPAVHPVKFVDSPLEVAASPQIVQNIAVESDDVPAPISLPLAASPAVHAVQFVDSPLEVVASPKIVQNIAEESDDVPAPINLPLAALPSVHPVQFVDSPVEAAPAVAFEKIDLLPLIIPSEVMESIAALAAGNSDVPASITLPLAPSPSIEDIQGSPSEAAEEVFAVKFVDSPVEAPVDPVKFVDEAVNVQENPSELESVKVVDLAINEETQNSVNIVDTPAESPRYPGKQYANPTWREAKESIDVPALFARVAEQAKNVIGDFVPSQLLERVKVEISNAVNVAEQPAESPLLPVKQYADPTWR